MSRLPLPIDVILPELSAVLEECACALVCAPPGSGKTTRVPPALYESLGGGRVLLLQPRRIAARASARRIAEERGCAVGGEVGYRVRFDNQTSSATRIEVLTEGLLTRQLQQDPFLEGVAAVVLDEFHERSLHSDVALALLREVQREARPDLKLVVMSATLDAEPIRSFLGGPDACPLLRAEGRAFDVRIDYQPLQAERPLEDGVVAAVHRAIGADPEGHVLVFLPGVGEIERAATALRGGLPSGTRVLPLHGSLKSADQDRVLQPANFQKIVLATNIAETSLTLDGVTTVVDSGLVRRPRFDARLGLDRLETVPHSRASSIQRAGRAGRTRAGRCIRLWTAQSQALREAHDPPAVAISDLAPTVLQLYAWGTRPRSFDWFERPPESALATAESLLVDLGALSEDAPRALSPLGTQLARLPVHPRLGRVIVAGRALGVLEPAAGAAALASERDPWRGQDGGDLLGRLQMLDSGTRNGADSRALAHIARVRSQLVRLGRTLQVERVDVAGSSRMRVVDALIAGFPDRVGMRRSPESRRLLLSGGQGAVLPHGHRCGPVVVAVSMGARARARGKEPTVWVTAEVDPERLDAQWVDEAVFDRERQAVSERRALRFGALVLESRPLPHGSNPEQVAAVLHQAARGAIETLFSFSAEDGRLLRRLRFARTVGGDEEWPPWIDDPACLLSEWCQGRWSFEQLMQLDLSAEFSSRLSWSQRQVLDLVAPDRLKLPGGRTARVQYPPGRSPILAARIQHLFGMMETPVLGGVPLTVHLLAPNGRPAQITQDLAGFWSGSYAQVRKDLRGRYPKHSWPEDPTSR